MYPLRLANEACGLEFEYRLTAIGTRLARGVGIAVYRRLGAEFAEISLFNCPRVAWVGLPPGHCRLHFPREGADCTDPVEEGACQAPRASPSIGCAQGPV